MDGQQQHRYEINLKTGDLSIDLASDDVYFISKQMDKWFRILLDDSYVPIALPSPPEPQPVQAVAAPPPPQPAEAPPQPAPVQQPVSQPEPVTAPPPMPAAVEVSMQPEVAAQTAPPTAIDMPAPSSFPPPPAAPVVQFADAPAGNLDETVQDDFEAVMDSLMEDLEGEEAPTPRHGVSYVGTNPGEYSEDHYHVASGNGLGERGKVDLSTIDSLGELCDRSRAVGADDYLLLSAYFLTYFEGLEKFSLKKINSLLVKSGLTPVNHSILETALSGGYLSMVPDMTGLADTTEYMLSDEGQRHAHSLL